MSTKPALAGISYNVKTAALVTGLSEWKIRDAIRENRLATVKDGRDHLIKHDELAAYIDALESA